MKSIFRLKLGNFDNSWELLNTDKNIIDGNILSNLGMKIIKPRLEAIFFSIQRNVENKWKIKNEGNDSLFVLKSKIHEPRKLYNNDYIMCDDLTTVTLYFDKNISSWQYFHFTREDIKLEIVDKPERLSENYRKPMVYNLSAYDYTGMINNIYINQMIKNNRKIIDDDECGSPKATCTDNVNKLPIAKKNKIVNDDETCEDIDSQSANNIPRVTYKINRNAKVIYDDEEEKRNELEDSIQALCEKVKNDQLKLTQQDNISQSKEALKKYDNFNENGRRVKSKQDKENLDLNEYMPSSKKALKRLKKNTDNKELLIESNSECPICLEKIVNLANLDSCNHDFCKNCIEKWAKDSSNNCPICKREFKKLIFYEKNKKIEYKVRKKRLNLDTDEFYFEYIDNASDICMVCASEEDPAALIICDRCDYNACHYYCDNLPSVPEGEWVCEECFEDSFIDNDESDTEVLERVEWIYSYLQDIGRSMGNHFPNPRMRVGRRRNQNSNSNARR
jgi:hypothetical protein